jgi:predicted dehydrogenase
MKKLTYGIVGCGFVFDIYAQAGGVFENLELLGCADILEEKARAKAEQFGIRHYGVDALVADPAIDLIVNLTVPQAHFPVAMAAIAAGKHVYNEKPFTVTNAEARALLAAADTRGLRVGCAPDTFLGAGLQTCRKLLDEGWIGTPVAATGFVLGHGPEHYHPGPHLFFQPGGGQIFDIGPYVVTALVALLGPVRRVTGSTRISYPTRYVNSQPHRGDIITPEVPTHHAGVLDFASGLVGTLVTSYDVFGKHNMPRMEIYGSQGTLSVPDPNSFGGPVRVHRRGDEEWREVPLAFGYHENSRGIGFADMASAIASGRPHRASGAMAAHVMDISHAIHTSSSTGAHVELTSGVDRPAPLPMGLRHGTID